MMTTKTIDRRRYRGMDVWERFLCYVKPLKNGCWRWTGGKSKGYGYFWNGKKLVRVSRYVLEHKLGRKLRKGMQACHTCDVTDCVNPDHLYEGTPQRNVRDCIERGRRGRTGPKGHSHPLVVQAGTTPALAHRVKRYLRKHSRTEACNKFNLSKSTVRKIGLGIHWSQK